MVYSADAENAKQNSDQYRAFVKEKQQTLLIEAEGRPIDIDMYMMRNSIYFEHEFKDLKKKGVDPAENERKFREFAVNELDDTKKFANPDVQDRLRRTFNEHNHPSQVEMARQDVNEYENHFKDYQKLRHGELRGNSDQEIENKKAGIRADFDELMKKGVDPVAHEKEFKEYKNKRHGELSGNSDREIEDKASKIRQDFNDLKSAMSGNDFKGAMQGFKDAHSSSPSAPKAPTRSAPVRDR